MWAPSTATAGTTHHDPQAGSRRCASRAQIAVTWPVRSSAGRASPADSSSTLSSMLHLPLPCLPAHPEHTPVIYSFWVKWTQRQRWPQPRRQAPADRMKMGLGSADGLGWRRRS